MEPTSRPSQPDPSAPVAEAVGAPYTAPVAGERVSAPVPWWRDTVKGWAPALTAIVMIVIHLMTVQQQIAETQQEVATLRAELPEMIRTEVRAEVGDLRTEIRQEMATLRSELRAEFRVEFDRLRAEIQKTRADVDQLRRDMAAMREEFGERITRLETLLGEFIERQAADEAETGG